MCTSIGWLYGSALNILRLCVDTVQSVECNEAVSMNALPLIGCMGLIVLCVTSLPGCFLYIILLPVAVDSAMSLCGSFLLPDWCWKQVERQYYFPHPCYWSCEVSLHHATGEVTLLGKHLRMCSISMIHSSLSSKRGPSVHLKPPHKRKLVQMHVNTMATVYTSFIT